MAPREALVTGRERACLGWFYREFAWRRDAIDASAVDELHMIFVDDGYTFEDERPRFHCGSVPAQPELQRLLHAIATRVTRALEKQGLLTRDDETPSLDLEPADGFEQLLGAAVHYRIAVGPHAGRKALTLHIVATRAPTHTPCIAQLSGFSLHAGTVCHPHQRGSLERLCRTIARPALSNERLSVNERGQVVFRLEHPFGDGTTLPAPRPDKTICDGPMMEGVRCAVELLKSGFRRGMVSEQSRRGWPQNVWAVDDGGIVDEAQLGNSEAGESHGYPMKKDDDFASIIGVEWKRRGT